MTTAAKRARKKANLRAKRERLAAEAKSNAAREELGLEPMKESERAEALTIAAKLKQMQGKLKK